MRRHIGRAPAGRRDTTPAWQYRPRPVVGHPGRLLVCLCLLGLSIAAPSPAWAAPEPTPARAEPTPARAEPTPARAEPIPARAAPTAARAEPTPARDDEAPPRDETDPEAARDAARPTPPRPLSDDPGIDQAIQGVLHEAKIGLPSKPYGGPNGAHLRLFYRGYRFHCAMGSCWYNGAGLVVYPTAWIGAKSAARILRAGIGLGGGGETSQTRERWWQHDFELQALVVLGLQYPWHLTPYVEFILGLGALHRNLYNKDDVFFAYSFGLELGVEWFAYRYFNLTASLGWRRSIVDRGPQSLYVDSLTFSVGLGF